MSTYNYLEDGQFSAMSIGWFICKLFRIINLPGTVDYGTHSVRFSNLPNFLVAAADLETFVELSKDDVQECSKIGQPLCKFHTGISKLNVCKFCVVYHRNKRSRNVVNSVAKGQAAMY
ncbi:hypothetical protein OUZ56_011760 [Daphnia magna]|uniref:Uncharacterized protein n=1 Tax=Daphnia magna TaxID=35525 RepID=A0ABQ9Z1C9_9CRUS|nr:hypothetical protein OUZ56_011760 [Daphnia magna]